MSLGLTYDGPAQGIAAVTGPQEPLEEMYRPFEERYTLVVDRVDAGLSCPRPESEFYASLDPGRPRRSSLEPEANGTT